MSIELKELYIYECDTPQYLRKDRPEAWTTLDKANGAMFRSYPAFSFIPGTECDEEPIRFGDFVIDIDTGSLACGAAIKIIDWFTQVYGVDPEQWRVYLSGKKGVHLELPTEIMGLEDGHKWLPLAYKRLASDIEGELQVKLDTSMYNRGTGKPYRQPNVMRDCGTCKRQIDYNDLFEIEDEDEYRAACCEPGEIWIVEDNTHNAVLAEKMVAYLLEVEEHQERLQNSRPLTDDEIDRLAITIPPCIKVLSTIASPAHTSNTFNDVAIQLTAYAITAGFAEANFLGGCQDFIYNYPSTSLNTLDKRVQNCQARYRTMVANGYQHSCGGIKALGFIGFNCAECNAMPNGPGLDVEVLGQDDVKDDNYTLNITAEIMEGAGGLIKQGMDGLVEAGMPDIPQYLLPTILSHIGVAISGKIKCGREWPNTYDVKIGGTSTSKSDTTDTLEHKIIESGLDNLYGVTDFASGPALFRSLVDTPQCLVLLDEITYLFLRPADKKDMVTEGKIAAMLQLFTKSGSRVKKSHSNSKESFTIDRPCMSILGNATPTIYSAIQQEDFDSGLIQRFNFWCYDGSAPYRDVDIAKETPSLDAFIKGLADLVNIMPSQCGKGNIAGIIDAVDIGMTEECSFLAKSFSRSITDMINSAENDGDKGLIASQYRTAIKFAMKRHAAVQPVSYLFEPLSAESYIWGQSVAKMLCDWKLKVLRGVVTSGDFDRDCELFKQAIRAAIKMGKRPTFNILRNRRRQLSNWKPRYTEEVVRVLVARKELHLDDSKKTTAYQLVK